jgi:hypothetical protein
LVPVQQTTDGKKYQIAWTEELKNAKAGDYEINSDSNGNEQWNQTYGESGSDIGYSVQQTTDGGYIITGYTNSYGSDYDVWLIKTDANGNEEWNQTFGGNAGDYSYSVQQTFDGGYIITGNTGFNGVYDVWLIKTDADGNEQWDQTFGGNNDDRGYSVQQTSDPIVHYHQHLF